MVDVNPFYFPKQKLPSDSPVDRASLVYLGPEKSSISSPRLFTSLPGNSHINSENFSDWLNTAGISSILESVFFLFTSSLLLYP